MRAGLGRPLGPVAMLLAGALAVLGPIVSDAAPPATAPAASTKRIAVEGGQLTVDVQDADLAAVLREIAQRAGVDLSVSGNLGQVTAEFTASSLESGLRRLVQQHELVLLYRQAASGSGDELAEIRVFAEGAARGGTAPSVAASGSEGSGSEDEIEQLLARRRDPGAVTRLAEILAGASEASVRVRAAGALAQVGGPAAVGALNNALGDDSAEVRSQVVASIGQLQGEEALPVLRNSLTGDGDVRVRRAAARALGAVKGPAAAAALSAAKDDPEPWVRREVERALRRHGSGDPE